ncbi:MAG: hypothetical protein OEX00_07090, partial [Gammaproteobacteria bacterium]|nr:hypothetical protein [Gammaproteobacteria bacterium]
MTNSRFFSGSLSRLLLLLLVVTLAACSSDEPPSPLPRQGSACDSDPVRFPRFKTNSSQLTIFQTSSCSYIPITLTGVNLGVATPGKYAGDLDSAATYADFLRWFQLMVDAGINVVRVYTLHMDFFYDALYDFNTQREIDGLSPLYLMQGVWLEENDTAEDFYDHTVSMSTNTFEVINAVYGNTTLSASGRPGKGYGTYTSNVSDWTIAWLMGREISPPEVSVTNSHIPLVDNYRGFILSLPNGSATEAWVTARMDDMLTYEVVNYSKTRPISFSSWPTLDPLTHPTENLIQNSNYEDREKLDLGNIDDSKAPAGVFISYHAYPYYPDFVSEDLNYRSYSDGSGANSYLGYLTALKAHYANKPVIIAEFGAPSSWGDVHASHSGMHHGGH